MTFFGTILLEKKIISKDQLVDALVSQSSQITSAMQICFEKKLMHASDILKVISNRKIGESFLSISEKLNLLDEAQKSTIVDFQKTNRQPLGQILVDKFGVNLNMLSEVLGESSTTTEKFSTQNVNLYKFKFAQVSGETKRQYLNFFSKEVKKSLEDGFNKISTDSSNLAVELMKLEEMAQQLAAAANFARMEVSYTLAEKLAFLVEGLSSKEVALTETRSEIVTLCLTALDILWELHRFIEISGDEKEFWINDVSRKNFIATMEKLEIILGGNN